MAVITAKLITNKNRKRDFKLTLDSTQYYTGKQIALLLNQEMMKSKDIFVSLTDLKVNNKPIDIPQPIPLNRFAEVMQSCIDNLKGVGPNAKHDSVDSNNPTELH